MKNFLNEIVEKVRGAKSKIVVNGHTIVGRNVSIVNGVVTVDGKVVELPDAKEIKIVVEGDLGSLRVDAGDVSVQGSCGEVEVNQGSVTVAGDVKGEIQVDQGRVECNDVYSDVKVDMGNINALTILGNATAWMGNISK